MSKICTDALQFWRAVSDADMAGCSTNIRAVKKIKPPQRCKWRYPSNAAIL